MAQIKMFASLSVETDLPTLWEEIKHIPNVHLGGQGSKYTVKYIGNQTDGMTLVNRLSQEADFDIQVTSISPLDSAE